MSYTPFQFLRGTTAQNNAYTGQAGEITVDIELNQIRVHDGVTLGGHIISNAENTTLDWNDVVNRPNGLISSSLQFNNLTLPLTGSLTGSLIGRVFGTSSYALTASYVPGVATSWDTLLEKPAGLVSTSLQVKVLLPENTVSSSTQITFSEIQNKPTLVSSSEQINYTQIQNKPTTIATASYVTYNNVADKPVLVSSSNQIQLNAISGVSFSNQAFYFPQDVTVEGKLTAQEYHTEIVSASIIYESGSTKFGDSADDTHQFTGSVVVNGGITGSLSGTSSYALKSEYADRVELVTGGSTTGQGIYNGQFTGSLLGTSSYALNAERTDRGFPFVGNAIITGSLVVSSSGITLLGSGLTGSVLGTASYAVSASRSISTEKVDVIEGGSTTGEGVYKGQFTGSLFGTSSYALNAERTDRGFPFSGSAVITGSLLVSGSGITGSLFGTSSYAISASRSISTETVDVISGGSTTGEGIYTGEFTGSLFGTSSYALNASRGDGFPYSGSAVITGSLLISGSGLKTTGSIVVFGDITANSITSSFKGEGSQLFFTTLNTSQSSNSQLVIGNIYNDYQYKQTTVFRNADVVISGSTTITDGGMLILTPQETPTPIAGGIFFSSSGQFYIGTE